MNCSYDKKVHFSLGRILTIQFSSLVSHICSPVGKITIIDYIMNSSNHKKVGIHLEKIG